jgi:MFS family permease
VFLKRRLQNTLDHNLCFDLTYSPYPLIVLNGKSQNYRRVKAKLDFTAIYGIAFINIALGYGLIAWSANYPLVGLGLILTGLGLGLLMPNMNFCLTSITSDNLRGRVLSGITTAFFLGQFLSPPISQSLSKLIGLGSTYGVAALLMLVGSSGFEVIRKTNVLFCIAFRLHLRSHLYH